MHRSSSPRQSNPTPPPSSHPPFRCALARFSPLIDRPHSAAHVLDWLSVLRELRITGSRRRPAPAAGRRDPGSWSEPGHASPLTNHRLPVCNTPKNRNCGNSNKTNDRATYGSQYNQGSWLSPFSLEPSALHPLPHAFWGTQRAKNTFAFSSPLLFSSQQSLVKRLAYLPKPMSGAGRPASAGSQNTKNPFEVRYGR